MKKIVFLLVMFVTAFTVDAQEKKLDKNKEAVVLVNGNCEMCKKRIEKAAFSVKGVKSASWNVANKNINLVFDESKTSQEAIEKAIAKVGHDTANERATDAAYDSIHGCCQYDRNQ